jgi:four helix bundle protein
MQSAAVSVPANIAEGFKRRGRADKIHFYNIAQGSLEELRYYFILCRDLEYKIDYEPLAERADRVGRMVTGLINFIRIWATRPVCHLRPTAYRPWAAG